MYITARVHQVIQGSGFALVHEIPCTSETHYTALITSLLYTHPPSIGTPMKALFACVNVSRFTDDLHVYSKEHSLHAWMPV